MTITRRRLLTWVGALAVLSPLVPRLTAPALADAQAPTIEGLRVRPGWKDYPYRDFKIVKNSLRELPFARSTVLYRSYAGGQRQILGLESNGWICQRCGGWEKTDEQLVWHFANPCEAVSATSFWRNELDFERYDAEASPYWSILDQVSKRVGERVTLIADHDEGEQWLRLVGRDGLVGTVRWSPDLVDEMRSFGLNVEHDLVGSLSSEWQDDRAFWRRFQTATQIISVKFMQKGRDPKLQPPPVITIA